MDGLSKIQSQTATLFLSLIFQSYLVFIKNITVAYTYAALTGDMT